MIVQEILGFPTDEQRAAAGLTTQAEYNAALQEVQALCLPWEAAHGEKLLRTKISYYTNRTPEREGKVDVLTVYFGSRLLFAQRNAMQPDCKYYISDDAVEWVRHEMARCRA